MRGRADGGEEAINVIMPLEDAKIMSVIAEVEKLAFSLPVNDRAKLADRLWDSLPQDFIDQEELELLMLRDREMDEDPTKVISHEEFLKFFEDRFKK